MQKPLVYNRYIHQKNMNKTNDYMLTKLSKVKPMVDVKCPESFSFSKVAVKKNLKTADICIITVI